MENVIMMCLCNVNLCVLVFPEIFLPESTLRARSGFTRFTLMSCNLQFDVCERIPSFD